MSASRLILRLGLGAGVLCAVGVGARAQTSIGQVQTDAPARDIGSADVSPPDIDVPQISPVAGADQTVDQIDIAPIAPAYTISQAEGGFDRCDPASESGRMCPPSRPEGSAPRRVDPVAPEIAFVTTVDRDRPNAVVDPVDAANRIGRGRPEGSDPALAIGQDFLSDIGEPAPDTVDPAGLPSGLPQGAVTQIRGQ